MTEDVEIMLEQLKIINDCYNDSRRIRAEKELRLERRLKNG